ncbi:GGDEF domain-containing protein [Treponema pectinovorum]|uniref:GGDEF domain-containing protein n=1 Tax=Treponema pectinovorum TaxID=164 RepID=UPI0011F136A8|nr:GGDEF domain-containing protein [Treponema pectinovorum]
MNRLLFFFIKNKLTVTIFGSLVCHVIWIPILFSFMGSEFLPSAVANTLIVIILSIILLKRKKLKQVTILTIYILCITAYSILQAVTTQLGCGMGLFLLACIPAISLAFTKEKPPKFYFISMDTILVLGIAFITFIKLYKLPPQQLFLPERRTFLKMSEVFYTIVNLSFLFYLCLMTDISLRLYKKKNSILQKKLEYISKHDSLTGLMNRRRTLEVFADIQKQKKNKNIDYAICIFDIDDFKKLNDTYGHDAGDTILKSFTKSFWEYFKEPIRIGRWGGEEFLIIYPKIDQNTISDLEKARKEIIQKPIIYDEKKLFVTATFGLSSSRKWANAEDVLQDADECLYRGKTAGKNRLVVSENF